MVLERINRLPWWGNPANSFCRVHITETPLHGVVGYEAKLRDNYTFNVIISSKPPKRMTGYWG